MWESEFYIVDLDRAYNEVNRFELCVASCEGRVDILLLNATKAVYDGSNYVWKQMECSVSSLVMKR